MSIGVQIRLPEAVVKEIDELVELKQYKSRAHFCEIAVYIAMKEIKNNEKRSDKERE